MSDGRVAREAALRTALVCTGRLWASRLGLRCVLRVHWSSRVLDRRRPTEPVALVIVDELMIGEALFVQFGLLVSHVRPFALAPSLLLGRAGPALSLLGPLLALRCILAIFANDPFSSPAELIFTPSDARALP